MKSNFEKISHKHEFKVNSSIKLSCYQRHNRIVNLLILFIEDLFSNDWPNRLTHYFGKTNFQRNFKPKLRYHFMIYT